MLYENGGGSLHAILSYRDNRHSHTPTDSTDYNTLHHSVL